ncbi:MAG: DUF2971 domain-containing protein [Smithella sp.]
MVRMKGMPVIDPELTDDTILWRYLDTAKYIDFLQGRELFFCRGDQFEDKYEGSFTSSLKNAIEQAYRKNHIAMTYEEFKKRLRERVFVNCWHKSPNDSMAMWQLYGKTNLAVAVTTTVGKLREELERVRPERFLSIKKVTYVKYWRDPALDIKPYSNVFAYKVTAYDFEKEVRVIIDRFDDEFEIPVVETGMRVKVRSGQLLISVVIMPEAPEWYSRLITDISARYKLGVPVHRSKLSFEPI